MAATASLSLIREGRFWTLKNDESGDVLLLSANAPLFEFEGFSLGGEDAGEGVWESNGNTWVGTWRLTEPRRSEIRTILILDEERKFVRRKSDVVVDSGGSMLLKTVVLDAAKMQGPLPALRDGVQSYPILGRSFYFGVEYPIAFARADADVVHIGHHPGRKISPGEVYEARSAVYGANRPGRSREAFEAYIAAMRPTPRGMHFNYNSWWTSPVPYTEKDILELIETFRIKLRAPYGVSPNTFCIDMGWAKNTTLWQIDQSFFPDGFAKLREACGAIDSRLGLWISPSGVYGQALDLSWAKAAGYEADTKACLGGLKYRNAFKRALLDHVSRYGIRHVKFDGYVPTCSATDHGHEPGVYSAESIAEGILDVFTELRKIAPDLWMEPTCFGFDPSPWWLQYVNSVIGTFGDDAPQGRVPCPTYRESYTTARDFYNLKGAHDILAPVAAQEVLGIIHQTAEPFQNDTVTTIMRGHQFVPLYINPQFMTPRRWEFLAALMKWARENAETLAPTQTIMPVGWKDELNGSAPRSPYGYGHWQNGKGLVCLRNPWIETATMNVAAIRDLGAPRENPRLCAKLIYPERRLLAPSISPEEELPVHLAPYETAVIEYGRELPRSKVQSFACQARAKSTLKVKASWFMATEGGPRFGPDYTRQIPTDSRCPRVRVAGEIEVPRGASHQLMLLIEGSSPISAPFSRITLHDREVRAEVVSSEAGWHASGAEPPEHWMWLTIPLAPGKSKIDADLMLDDPTHRVSAWIAGRRRIPWRKLQKVDGTVLPPPEERWTDATIAFNSVKFGDDMPVERGPVPVIRINGIYLDALEPLEATQGWGELQRNRSVWEKPMVIGGKHYLRGLGTHAPSRIVFALDGKYRRFQAWAGADEATGPTITMEVHVDGRTVWKSGLLTRGVPAVRLDVDLQGAKRLELLVGDGGNGMSGDHADWADAMLLN